MFSALYKECFYLSHILQCYFSLYCVSNIFIFSLSIGLSSFVKSAAPSSLHFPVFVFVIGQMLQAPPLSCEHTGETSVCLLLIQLGWSWILDVTFLQYILKDIPCVWAAVWSSVCAAPRHLLPERTEPQRTVSCSTGWTLPAQPRPGLQQYRRKAAFLIHCFWSLEKHILLGMGGENWTLKLWMDGGQITDRLTKRLKCKPGSLDQGESCRAALSVNVILLVIIRVILQYQKYKN